MSHTHSSTQTCEIAANPAWLPKPNPSSAPAIQQHGITAAAPGPEPTPMAFAAWLQQQAADYREIGSDRALWLARQIEVLAREARILGADSPAVFDDRRDAYHDLDHNPAVAAHHLLQPAVAASVYRRDPLPAIDDVPPDDDEVPAVIAPNRHD